MPWVLTPDLGSQHLAAPAVPGAAHVLLGGVDNDRDSHYVEKLALMPHLLF